MQRNRIDRDMIMEQETIAAIATSPGEGGIGIIRISGPRAEEILRAVFLPAGGHEQRWESHRMVYGFVTDGAETVDEGMAVLMRAPRSYTREDVAELQMHGGAYVLRKALYCCLNRGARLAAPGEFTRRAFLNGRIDLSRAEAVMSLIAARGEQEHRAAVREMRGGVTAFVRTAADQLYEIQAGLAACVDYPEEISEEEGASEMIPKLETLIDTLRNAIRERDSRLIHQGLRVALVGRPNVGKSSLLNALLGEEKAIVTAVPGTTRDLVSGEMTLDGIRVTLTDTAGVREASDEVERIGVERSRRAMTEADAVLLVLDGSTPLQAEDRVLLQRLPEHAAVVVNKQDLAQAICLPETERKVIRCSVKQPESLGGIRSWLRTLTEVSDRMEVTQPRHLDALRRTVQFLESALETARTMPPDLAATDLQSAQAALGEITGDQVDERLLDTVFEKFCVGK